MHSFDARTCQNCQPGRACRAHSAPVADGAVVRVPMAMMDSMQRDLAARVDNADVRAQARADQERWKLEQAAGGATFDSAGLAQHQAAKAQANARMLADAQTTADRVQGYADGYAQRDVDRAATVQAHPAAAAYNAMCRDLDPFSRIR